jgi:glycerol-3-phosphate acyltransferase PlsY
MNVKVLLFAIIAYLTGSLNPATILTYIHVKRDIRELGDGNPGATNVFLHVNRPSGVIVFIIDASKSFFILWLGKAYGLSGAQLAVIGGLIIIGHNFPVFHKFKGGTGISSFVGGLLFMSTVLATEVLTFVLPTIYILYVIKTKKELNYSSLEIGEIIGFLLILYFAYISSDYTFKTYVFLSAAVVVVRRFGKVTYFIRKFLARSKLA